MLKGLLTCRWDEPSIQHHPSPSPKHVTVQPVFGHLASPTNLISPGTSQRQSRRHLTLGLRKPGVVRERRGGGSRAAGRGRQRTPRGRAGSWQGGQAGGISRPGRPSPRGQQTGRRFCTSRGAEDFPRLCPRTKPTAGVVANFTAYSPPNYESPQGCRRVRLVPGSKTGGGRIGMGEAGVPAKDKRGSLPRVRWRPRPEERILEEQGGHGPNSRLRGRGLAAEIGKGRRDSGQIWGKGYSGQK